ncbi:MAG: hypothetical protein KC418_02260, partial [Anaerolineales bacterium]|nr:hypothetical protein [Anaerolineales bacterium]
MPASYAIIAMHKHPNYHVYLLRLWQETPDSPWRILLENAHTGERCGFLRVSQLSAFLGEQMQLDNPQTDAPGDTRV